MAAFARLVNVESSESSFPNDVTNWLDARRGVEDGKGAFESVAWHMRPHCKGAFWIGRAQRNTFASSL
jgi:hypothetical protein